MWEKHSAQQSSKEVPLIVKLVLLVFLICVIPTWEYYCIETLFPLCMNILNIDEIQVPIVVFVILAFFALLIILAIVLVTIFCIVVFVSRMTKGIFPRSKQQVRRPRKW